MESTSKKYQLNGIDLRKLGTGLMIAVIGATLTYLEDQIPGIDFGNFTPVVVALNSVIVNVGRKFLVNYQ